MFANSKLSKWTAAAAASLVAVSVAGASVGVVGTAHAAPAGPAAPVAAPGDDVHPKTVDDLQRIIDKTSLSREGKAALRQALEGTSNSEWRAYQAERERLGLDNPYVEAGLSRAIDPDDYECDPNTRLSAYVDRQLADLNNPYNVLVLELTGGLALPQYDAVFNGADLPKQFDGGNKTALVKRTHQSLRKFWDIKSGDIDLVPMTSGIFADAALDRQVEVTGLMFDLDPDKPADRAEIDAKLEATDQVFAQEPSLRDGKAPIFTLNAFAFSAEGETDPVWAGVSDKLAFGDGMFKALNFMKTGALGPQGVLGHEFGHHIQFERNAFSNKPSPEATRRTELMADGFAGYFGSHRLGLDIGKAKQRTMAKLFYNIGDCSFDSDGHHGTPNQRKKATKWGLTAGTRDGRKIIRTKAFIKKFDKALPGLVKPDA